MILIARHPWRHRQCNQVDTPGPSATHGQGMFDRPWVGQGLVNDARLSGVPTVTHWGTLCDIQWRHTVDVVRHAGVSYTGNYII